LRCAYLNERCPKIKDSVGFQREGKKNSKVKINGHEIPNFVKEKGKTHITHDVIFARGNAHAMIYHAHVSHARHNVCHTKIAHMPNVKISNASNGSYMSYHTNDVSYVLSCKYGKVVAKCVCAWHKNTKSCVSFPKMLVTNVKDHKPIWVPKNKA
jgi:hypothetical protein